jgi:hypothetical protein
MFGPSVMAYGSMLLYAGVGLCYDCNKLDGVNKIEFKNQKCAFQNIKFKENSHSMKVKVTFTVEQAMGAQRGSTGVVLFFL